MGLKLLQLECSRNEIVVELLFLLSGILGRKKKSIMYPVGFSGFLIVGV